MIGRPNLNKANFTTASERDIFDFGPSYKQVHDRPANFEARSTPRDRDKQWMRDWVCSRLFDLFKDECENDNRQGADEIDILRAAALRASALLREAKHESAAVRAAELGDIMPLRRMFPEHAKFINLPRQSGQGKRWSKKPKRLPEADDPDVRIQFAVRDVSRIRAIWMKYYGRSNSPRGGPTAEEIAAWFWSLTEEEVRMKRLSRVRANSRSSSQ